MVQEQHKQGVNVTLLLSREVNQTTLVNQRKYYRFEILDIKQARTMSFKSYDLVVFHSTYIPLHSRISRKLINNEIPYIVVPHGGMTQYSQKRRKLKKNIGNLVFFNSFIKNSSKIHYLSTGEYENSKHWNRDYFIYPNGIEIDKKGLNNSVPINNKKIIFTSISRLDIENKGLDIQLEAVSLLRDEFLKKSATMNIYGPSINGSENVLNDKIQKFNLGKVVKVHPPVYGEQKSNILKNTSVFVLLSKSEGQPMGVLEALSYKIPSLLTIGTNLAEDAERYKFGWKVDSNADAIARKMKKILDSDFKLEEFGENAFQYIKAKHSWDLITQNLIEEYINIIKKNEEK